MSLRAPQVPDLMQRVAELPEHLERLIRVQRWRARRQHGDRPPPVLHELRTRQVGHGRIIGEQLFDYLDALEEHHASSVWSVETHRG